MGLDTDLSVEVGPLRLKNPVMVASGTAAYGEELDQVFPIEQLGAVVTKSLTLKPKKGKQFARGTIQTAVESAMGRDEEKTTDEKI